MRLWSIPGDDRGAATVVALAMVAALLAVAGGGITIGTAVIGRHRVQAAADLAALVAAAALPAGTGPACAQAVQLARQLQINDIDCTVDGLDVVVTASVPVLSVGGRAYAVARAGPVATE